MFKFLDILLTLAHLVLIGFNLIGWIWPKTRKAHLVCLAATAGSWVLLGIWFGFGYCFLTDWHWKVKAKLGETNLPNSFIKYFADKISGKDFDAKIIDAITLYGLVAATILSLYVNFLHKIILGFIKKRKQSHNPKK